MRRWAWRLLHLLAALSLVAGGLPAAWVLLTGDTDPRANLGRWAVIVHMKERFEVVIRPPTGEATTFHYQHFSAVCHGFLVLYACLWVGRLTVARAAHERRERRFARGLCGDCGYDLRGKPGRCPECGAERYPVDRDAGRPAAKAQGEGDGEAKVDGGSGGNSGGDAISR